MPEPPPLENELPKPRPKPTPVPKAAPLGEPGTITQKDRNLLFKTATEMGWTEGDVKSLLLQLFTYTSTAQLTPKQLTEVLACINRPQDNGVSFEQVEGQTVLVIKR